MKLKENDWLYINTSLLNMYSQTECTSLLDNDIMERIRVLIPYDKASFFLHNYGEGFMLIEPSGIGFADGLLESKIKVVNCGPPHSWLKYTTHSVAVRDSDIFDEEEISNSAYHTELLIEEGIKYALTMVLVHNGMRVGMLTLFREKTKQDFSDREVYIVQQLIDHLAYYAYTVYGIDQNAESSHCRSLCHISEKYELTSRECDVLSLLLKGFTTKDMCSTLNIAEPTVRKHIGSIYSKMNIKNRTELLAILSSDIIE